MDEVFEVEFQEQFVVEPVIEALNVTENGEYSVSGEVDGYSPVTVNVQPTLESLNVTENGEYFPAEGVDGFSSVDVDVQIELEEITVKENGEYLPSGGYAGFSKVIADFPTPKDSKDVNFIDYDGTIVYSYTKAEFLALASMPDNPSHERLTAQGWNWTLADAKEYVADYDGLIIGQQYITTSGATEIDFELFEGSLAPYCGFGLNGVATIDWGDGSTISTVQGNNIDTIVNTQHTYSTKGVYTIKIKVVSGQAQIIGENQMCRLLNNGGVPSANYWEYRNCIFQVFIGSLFLMGDSGLARCDSLNCVTLPSELTSSAKMFFYEDNCLKAITMPMNLSDLSQSFYYNCRSLKYISFSAIMDNLGTYIVYGDRAILHLTLPPRLRDIKLFAFGSTGLTNLYVHKNIEEIGSYAFNGCGALRQIKFESSTPPVVSSSNTFQGIPTDCKIYVPQGSLSAYTSATNYPSSSTYQYIEY